MKTLYLLRHAIAEERDSGRFSADSKRPLTKSGIQKMRRIARNFGKKNICFDRILTSSFERAYHTAYLVKRICEHKRPLIKLKALEPGGSVSGLIKELNHYYKKHESLLLVGHEPDLSLAASYLISGSPDANLRLKKGGLLKIACDMPVGKKSGSLELLLTPKAQLG